MGSPHTIVSIRYDFASGFQIGRLWKLGLKFNLFACCQPTDSPTWYWLFVASYLCMLPPQMSIGLVVTTQIGSLDSPKTATPFPKWIIFGMGTKCQLIHHVSNRRHFKPIWGNSKQIVKGWSGRWLSIHSTEVEQLVTLVLSPRLILFPRSPFRSY